MNDLKDMLDAFREFTVIVRGRSPQGADTYIRHVKRFARWLEERDEEITSASQKDIEDWLKELFYRHNLVNSSRASMLSAIKQFYSFLVRERVLSGSPAARVPSPDFRPKSARKFTTEELVGIFSGPDGTEVGIRDKAILMLLYGAGPRVSEIANLQLGRLSFTARTLTVTFLGKGAKERTVKLLYEPAQAIRAWYELRVASGAGPGDPLFTSLTKARARRGFKLSLVSMGAVLKKYARRVGIADADAFVHKMRSTFASDLYDITRDILAVAAKMGHEDVKTTMKYIEISETALNQAVITSGRWRQLKGGQSGKSDGGRDGDSYQAEAGAVLREQGRDRPCGRVPGQ